MSGVCLGLTVVLYIFYKYKYINIKCCTLHSEPSLHACGFPPSPNALFFVWISWWIHSCFCLMKANSCNMQELWPRNKITVHVHLLSRLLAACPRTHWSSQVWQTHCEDVKADAWKKTVWFQHHINPLTVCCTFSGHISDIVESVFRGTWLKRSIRRTKHCIGFRTNSSSTVTTASLRTILHWIHFHVYIVLYLDLQWVLNTRPPLLFADWHQGATAWTHHVLQTSGTNKTEPLIHVWWCYSPTE